MERRWRCDRRVAAAILGGGEMEMERGLATAIDGGDRGTKR